MKHIISIILFACICISVYAQTPYDSFAPETSRPILDMGADMCDSHDSPDTILCVAVIDVQRQMLSLVSLPDGEILATSPITDDIRKWLSVDPHADNYPNISPYAYCGWNPIKNIDPDGRDTRTGTPGYENEGVWVSAQNTTYQHPQSSYDAQQMPYGEYFHNQGQLNQGSYSRD